ncbi:MAG: alanine racemase [Gammaproteobacteria bacterium]|nr:alanine racemase [Gammaproteobacteria bacterium]
MEPSSRNWQTPSITQHKLGAMNKYGALRDSAYVEAMDGVRMDTLLKTYGSPLFVISERKLRENVRTLLRAFQTRYPKVIHAWSYKTNYLSVVCNILHQEGSFAEVVSEFEYEKARHLGVPGKYIIFNGPNKKLPILQTALREGAKIHVDHFDELYLLENLTRHSKKLVPITIRLNFNTGYGEPWNRFGFNLESGEAYEAARRIASHPKLRLTGLHSHIGTFMLDTRAYAAEIKILCDFMEAVESLTGTWIENLDIGGGFASCNALQGIYLPPEQVVPSFDQYAETICTTLLEATQNREARGKPRPTLTLETGRAIVDDAEVLLTSVVGNKKLPDGRRAVVLDAGVNLLFTAFWYHHEVRPIRALEGIPEETVLYGPLCMNIDVMRSSVFLPPLSAGDALLFSPVGAYNNTQWLQFIGYRPNIVLIQETGEVSVVRKAEDLNVMIGQEALPKKLQNSGF